MGAQQSQHSQPTQQSQQSQREHNFKLLQSLDIFSSSPRTSRTSSHGNLRQAAEEPQTTSTSAPGSPTKHRPTLTLSTKKPPKLNLELIAARDLTPKSARLNKDLWMQLERVLPPWFSKLHEPTYLQRIWKSICEMEQNRAYEFGMEQAQAGQNRRLNRYIDILPFDHNRVVINGDGYINASYMHSIHGDTYIATQGPLPHTVFDFWRMVWEQNSRVITMLTQEEEKGRVKCAKYWMDLLEMPDMVLELLHTETDADTVKRKFALTHKSTMEKRQIIQYQLLNWPDHSTSDLDIVLNLLYLVSTDQEAAPGPLIVHCSAGCGRTATFLTILSTLSHLENKMDPNVDVIAMQVQRFRRDRIGSVQTFDQFVFCYDAVLAKINTILQ